MILNNWPLIRIVKLIMGVIALTMAIFQKDISLVLVAGFLLITAIANIGCCGRSGCAVDLKTSKNKKTNYEELDK